MIRIGDIRGHVLQREELLSDLASDNVAHAYLFSGKRHLGKMSIAHWFALELLSHEMEEEQQQNVRNQVERLVHPDFLVLDQLWIEGICDDWDVIGKLSNIPQQHRAKRPSAKTDTISIDDVRILQERLYETGTGRWRCCLIRSVERMQDPAANAFLKILEEPPPGLVFLLTTQTLSSLLPTVISRTRVLKFRPLSRPDISPLLSPLSDDDIQFILHLAQGAPGVAVTLRENPDALRDQRLMHAQAQSFWQAHLLRERLQLLSPLHKRDERSDQFLTHLSLTLREQMPGAAPVCARALSSLAAGLRTNAHRQLLAQEFALALNEMKEQLVRQ